MAHNTEQQPIIDTLNQKREFAGTFPEILANPPLENTSYVFSIPVMREWKNGNALRMLRAMFSQRIKQGEALEIELITNIGDNLKSLLVRDEKNWRYETDAAGNYLLSNPTEENTESQKKAWELLEEMDELRSFLEKILLAQKLSRILNQNPKDTTTAAAMKQLLETISEPLQKSIIELAIQKAASISLAVIDATRTVFYETDYQYVSLESLRTLGADVASVRFADKKDTVVLGLYDADTVPESNTAISEVQEIFNKYSKLTYCFTGMTSRPAGHTTDFVADAPRESIKTTWVYNSNPAHGSPQISFRLSAYEKLQEIAGWTYTGFQGYEDRDTAYRLIYHFGSLQENLLLEATNDFDLFPPTAMTADRVDGSVDSAARKATFAETGVRHITTDISNVLKFQEELLEAINKLPQEKKEKAQTFLNKAREKFEKKQRVQSRFNRLILSTFLDMVEEKAIRLENTQLIIDTAEITQALGGDALLHYLEANQNIVQSILSSENDIVVIEYLLGRRDTLPESIVSLSPFQQAIREYVGSVVRLEDMKNTTAVSVHKDTSSEDDTQWVVTDQRDFDSKDSLMHTVVAEILALGYTHRVFFETQQFLESRNDSQSSLPSFSRQWPENPDEQELQMNFGNQKERLEKIKSRMPKEENKTKQGAEQSEKWYKKLPIRSFSIFRLFQALSK